MSHEKFTGDLHWRGSTFSTMNLIAYTLAIILTGILSTLPAMSLVGMNK